MILCVTCTLSASLRNVSYDLVLAFLRGSAEIRIGDQVYHCVPGDKLNIPGVMPHSGVVGTEGVVYLMTQVVNCAD